MSVHLVTGYAGSAHITSADQGAFNASVVGTGEYVMCTGNELSAQVVSNNQIRIFDGDAMMQGRHINIKQDTYEDVAIANGLQGLNRNDLIVLRYTKDANTGVENVALAVLQGVSTEGTASDPSYTEGDILSGECLLAEMPLYRVPLTGLNVGELVPLFTVVDSMADHKAEMDVKLKAVNEQVESCFQSVSDGKALVASAITDKGVSTDATATFATMAENIANLSSDLATITSKNHNATPANNTSQVSATAKAEINLEANSHYHVTFTATTFNTDPYNVNSSASIGNLSCSATYNKISEQPLTDIGGGSTLPVARTYVAVYEITTTDAITISQTVTSAGYGSSIACASFVATKLA